MASKGGVTTKKIRESDAVKREEDISRDEKNPSLSSRTVTFQTPHHPLAAILWYYIQYSGFQAVHRMDLFFSSLLVFVVSILSLVDSWQSQARLQQRRGTSLYGHFNKHRTSEVVDDKDRRTLLSSWFVVSLSFPFFHPTYDAIATEDLWVDTLYHQQRQKEIEQQRPFRSAAFSKKEYTNSIVASRDTNISPLEVYETLEEQLLLQQQKQAKNDNKDVSATTTTPAAANAASTTTHGGHRALDVGAGAGVSTQLLYEMGYTEMWVATKDPSVHSRNGGGRILFLYEGHVSSHRPYRLLFFFLSLFFFSCVCVCDPSLP